VNGRGIAGSLRHHRVAIKMAMLRVNPNWYFYIIFLDLMSL
jgi:hypothetical protein